MPSGRVLIVGPPGDALLAWMLARLRECGYEPRLLDDEASALISLTPIVAGLDLWRVAGEERFEAVAALDERLPPGRPLLSLCNATSVDDVASYAMRGERVVGVGVFGPPREGMLAEVLPGLGTESGVVTGAAAFLSDLGFAVEILPPGAWAVYPRVVSMIINEAAVAIAEGVATAADIDMALELGAGYAQGPLALADEIGLGEVLAVLEALHAEYGDDRYRPAPLLRRLVLAGYTGRAAGRGFHLHP